MSSDGRPGRANLSFNGRRRIFPGQKAGKSLIALVITHRCGRRNLRSEQRDALHESLVIMANAVCNQWPNGLLAKTATK
jgi:hypothetical protein